MMPIQKLLSKIQWDENLDPRDFSIGYLDRIKGSLIYRNFEDIEIDKNDKFSFTTISDDGKEHHIPFHRIRVVLERGKVVWERPKETI